MDQVTVLPGDGIGPEICAPAVEVLKAVAERFGIPLVVEYADIGGIAIDKTGNPLPPETVERCKAAKAVLLGAVGDPKYENQDIRPEQGLLQIREALGLFANLRPAIVYPELREASPLKQEILGESLDILVVRELIGGIYFGKRGRTQNNGIEGAFDTEEYTVPEVQRIAHIAFRAAQNRGQKVCSIDKANVLESSRLWRKTVIEVAKQYPNVQLTHLYVDNAAMQLVRNPQQFDVILTNNIFGDILSDEASQITGSIGMLPSASLGEGGVGMYEPIHGSAPDIAGQNKANPLATILSVALLLRYSFGAEDAAVAIEQAVERLLAAGVRTADIAQPGEPITGTRDIGQHVIKYLT